MNGKRKEFLSTLFGNKIKGVHVGDISNRLDEVCVGIIVWQSAKRVCDHTKYLFADFALINC